MVPDKSRPLPPRASLERILADLGTTLLEPIHGDPSRAERIRNVVFHDPLDDSPLPRDALVLGIGLSEPDDVVALLGALDGQGAAGLVLRSPVTTDDRVAAAAEAAGVVVLGLTRGASWAQLAALLRSLIAEGDVGETSAESLGGMPFGDLFAIANAVTTLLDAPITIEDRGLRVLAFSGRQDEADVARVETILGRQVPDRFERLLEEHGVFQAVYRSRTPVDVPPLRYSDTESTLPRVALAVRAGEEVLGSIWATVREPLSPERSRALQDAAKLVAMHLLRLRAGADVERRLRADLVATALEGGPGSLDAVDRLGLADHGYLVIALALTDSTGPADTERQRIADAFSMHLAAVYPRAASALLNDVVYGIANVRGDEPSAGARAEQAVTEFLDRISEGRRLVGGIGGLALTRSDLLRSREGADRALRVLRTGRSARRVAQIGQVHVDALLLELADLAADRDEPAGPVARLIEYDARRGASMVETLSAWLNAFGDVTAAAKAVYTHQNTFRYRLRRLAEIGDIDLSDPDARFAAMLELRLLRGDSPHQRQG